MSGLLQIQRVTPGSLELNTNVIFDATIHLTGNISYDNVSGTITLQEPGIYEFVWWVATQASTSNIGASFMLVSSQGDAIIGNSPIITGEVVGNGIIEVTTAPVTVALRNSNNAAIAYSSFVPVKASLTVISQANTAATGNIIPYTSGVLMGINTNDDGSPDLVGLVSFGGYSAGRITDGQIDALYDNMSFVFPRDGVIQAISAVLSTRMDANFADATAAVTLQLYSAAASDAFFSPVPGTAFTLAPTFTGNVPEGSNTFVDSPELAIPVTRGTRLMLVYSLAVVDGPPSQIMLSGYASAGISIL